MSCADMLRNRYHALGRRRGVCAHVQLKKSGVKPS
jgi:hypothetical protein